MSLYLASNGHPLLTPKLPVNAVHMQGFARFFNIFTRYAFCRMTFNNAVSPEVGSGRSDEIMSRNFRS